MTNGLYDKAREAFLNGEIDWTDDTIKVVLVDEDAGTGYTPNLSTDQYLSTISGISGAVVSTSSAIANKTTSTGIADGDDITFSTVTAGDPCDSIVIYKEVLDGETPDDTASPLIAYIDTATGLPVTPNGGNIIIQWDSGTNKIFKL